MTQSNESTHRETRGSRLAGAVLFATLAAAFLVACVGDQPVSPTPSAPDAPSLTLDPTCADSGGQTHADSILAPETWSRANNPHRVYTSIHIEGAGVLTLEPGVLVCVGPNGGFWAAAGGRLVANGLDTARITLTGNPALGWWGVHLTGSPASPSSLKHVRLEHTSVATALSTHEYHAVNIDSTVFRQNEHGLYLWGRGTTIRRSRVDTVTSAANPAVTLGNILTFEQNVIRGAAGVGVAVLGTNGVSLLGGRIENSGDVGLKVTTTGPGFVDTEPVRVVGGASYPAEMVVSAFPRIYPVLADQDSLLGNARDTLVVTGGILQAWASPGPALPWRVRDGIIVQHYGILIPRPGATLVFEYSGYVIALNGGRVIARGTAAAPVLFTGTYWSGLYFQGTPALNSYLTNVRIEHAAFAVSAAASHGVVIDSSVIRQSGIGVFLGSNSRISRSRVDTTTATDQPAVMIFGNSFMESTRIRGAGERGVWLLGGSILSCDIRGSAGAGIDAASTTGVHNCNLVDNGGPGLEGPNDLVDAEDNWWGDAAGPTGTNGDGVSGAVDYTPWRTTPYVLPYVP